MHGHKVLLQVAVFIRLGRAFCRHKCTTFTMGGLGVNDTPVFLLNEYIVELNPANFNILNQILN